MKAIFTGCVLLALTACSQTPKTTQQSVEDSSYTEATEAKPYQLQGTTTFAIDSKETGSVYNISVSVPDSYAHAGSTKTYPVIYVLDGQWRFPLVYSIVGAITEDGDMPEALIVSISWQETNNNLLALRGRDLTPTATAEIPQSGEAIKFQNFLRNQLFPYIEKNYKGSTHRTVTGGSFSGLFAVYTLLTQPDLFDGYIAATPSLWWDEHSINYFFKQFPNKPLSKRTRFYLSWGKLESADYIRRFGEDLKNKEIPNLEVTYAPVENSGHSAVNAESYTKGLQFVFQKDDLLLPQARLKALAGQYKSQDDLDDIQFIIKDGKLQAVFSDGNRFMLNATSNNEFYIQGNAMIFTFNSTTQALQLSSRGTEFNYIRR